MRNLRFGFFDGSGLPVDSRILIFYSFETEDHLPRSGILHYNIPVGRFVGPRHAPDLTQAAFEFLSASGRLPVAPAHPPASDRPVASGRAPDRAPGPAPVPSDS